MIVDRYRIGFMLAYICAQTDMILAYTECSRIDKHMCYYRVCTSTSTYKWMS